MPNNNAFFKCFDANLIILSYLSDEKEFKITADLLIKEKSLTPDKAWQLFKNKFSHKYPSINKFNGDKYVKIHMIRYYLNKIKQRKIYGEYNLFINDDNQAQENISQLKLTL